MTPTALILAAGINKRLWPITTSKALLEFAGKPIITYIIDDLKAAGITQFIIVANPDNQSKLAQLFPQAQIVVQDQPTGMADGVLTAQKLLTGPILVVNSSDLFNTSLFTQVAATLKATAPKVLLMAVSTSQYLPAGYFVLDGDRPVKIIEKPKIKDKPSNLARAVIDYFADARILFSQLIRTRAHAEDGYEQALNSILSSQEVELHTYTGPFHQLKYPWQILDMMEFILTTSFKPHQAESVSVHPTAVIAGPVVLAEGVKVLPHATISGPSFIGPRTIIGNNALVRDSIVAADCIVGYNTEVARSWVGAKCWFHSNYIGDSVLESDISFGAGALTANFRLDQQPVKDTGRIKLGAIIGSGTRVGVNTSLMPGIKLGNQVIVGPGLVLNKDLADQQTHFK